MTVVVWGRPTDGSNISKDGGGPTGVRRGAEACRRLGGPRSLLAFIVATAALLLFAGPAAAAVPDTTITSGPGAFTKDKTPRFKFTSSEGGPDFECRVAAGSDASSASWSACTSPYDTPTLSPDGTYTFEVRALDAVTGDPDPTPASHTFLVDSTKPSLTIDSEPPDPTNQVPQHFEFSTSDPSPSSGAPTTECRIDTGSWDPCSSAQDLNLADGDHTFRVRSTDPAGNVQTRSFNFTLDTVAPTLSVTTVPDLISNDPSPAFEFTAADASPSSGLSTKCRIDGGSWSNCSSPYTPSLSDGVHTIEIKAVDGAGNEDGGNFSYTFQLDTVAPDTSITNAPGSHLLDHSPSFDFDGTDAAPSSGIVGYECRIDGGGWNACTNPWNTPFSDGVHSFEVRAIDAAGNVDGTPAQFLNFTVDTVAPNTSITSHPPQYSNDTNPSFSFTGSDPAPSSGLSFMCRLDGGSWSSCSDGDHFSAPEGNHTFEVKAVDGVGNEDPTPASYSWMVDTTDPDITLNHPLNKERFLLHANPVDYSCSDPLHGGPPAVHSGVASCTDNGFDNENLGPHYFIVTATDRAGNSSTEKVAYTIDPPDYGKFVKEDHPLAYYRFNEALGSDTMTDSSGHHHDGIYQNGIATQRDGATSCERRPHPPRSCELASPAENKAAYFPARDGHGYVNGITAPTDAYTMEAWVNPRDSQNMMILGHGGGGQLFISGGHLAFRQTQDTIYGGGPTLTPGKWWHVAATWDGHDTYLYVNGKQIAHSDSANKPPSGTSTFYVGYGEMAPWFHGTLDEAAYYDHALSQHRIADRYKIGTAKDHHSLVAGNSPYNTEGPSTDPTAPKNKGIYAPNKVPKANFSCHDPDGASDIASCTAKVDGTPIASGDPLPDSIGTHTFVVTAVDKGGNTYVHTHTYEVLSFADLYRKDKPVAYYRLGESSGQGTQPMNDSSGNHRDGEYKNGTESGPVGIAGDGDHARRFTGADGYGYANGIQAPQFQSSLVAWVNADSTADASIVGHGDAGELFIRGGTFQYRRMDTIVDSHVAPKPGHWQQVVGTWDGVDIRIYVNGKLKGTVESTKRPSSASTFYVGYGELEPWFAGTLDEVAYYPIGLSSDRVYQLWLADPPADLSKTGTGVAAPLAGAAAPLAVAAAPRVARPEAAPRARAAARPPPAPRASPLSPISRPRRRSSSGPAPSSRSCASATPRSGSCTTPRSGSRRRSARSPRRRRRRARAAEDQSPGGLRSSGSGASPPRARTTPAAQGFDFSGVAYKRKCSASPESSISTCSRMNFGATETTRSSSRGRLQISSTWRPETSSRSESR